MGKATPKDQAKAFVQGYLAFYNEQITGKKWLDGLVIGSGTSDKTWHIVALHQDGFERWYEVEDMREVTKEASEAASKALTDSAPVLYYTREKLSPKAFKQAKQELQAQRPIEAHSAALQRLKEGRVVVGDSVRVWWPDEGEWFEGVVQELKAKDVAKVKFLDGDEKDYSLREAFWELLAEAPAPAGAATPAPRPAVAAPKPAAAARGKAAAAPAAAPAPARAVHKGRKAAAGPDVVVYEDNTLRVVCSRDAGGSERTEVILSAGMDPEATSVQVSEQCIAIKEKPGKRKVGPAQEFYIITAKSMKVEQAHGDVADDGTVRVNVPTL